MMRKRLDLGKGGEERAGEARHGTGHDHGAEAERRASVRARRKRRFSVTKYNNSV